MGKKTQIATKNWYKKYGIYLQNRFEINYCNLLLHSHDVKGVFYWCVY